MTTVNREGAFLRIREAAELLGCSPKRVRRAVLAGAIPAIILGERQIRIPRAALLALGTDGQRVRDGAGR